MPTLERLYKKYSQTGSQAIIEMSHTLGVNAQGYLFAPPVRAEEFEKLLQPAW